MKTEIAAKDQKLKELRRGRKLTESQKLRREELESLTPMQGGKTLEKIAEEIREIKEQIPNKKDTMLEELELEDFSSMERLGSESEDEDIEQKIVKLERVKQEIADERRDIKAQQEEVDGRKDKWKNTVAYLRNSSMPGTIELANEKADIDLQIRIINKRITANKAKSKKVKLMETQLRPYIDRKENNKKSFSSEKKVGTAQSVLDNFFDNPPEFETLEPILISSDND